MASKEISQLDEQAPCCPSPLAPILCVNNCGFFGTRENNNLCSFCFKKALMASIKPSPSSSSVLDGSSALCSKNKGSPALSSVKEPSPSTSSLTSDDALVTSLCLVDEGLPALCSSPSPSPSPSPLPLPSTCAEPDPADLSTSLTALSISSTCVPPPPKNSNRCFSCRKRVGLTGIKCRCGNVFCSLHRYSDNHDCSFDYKAVARNNIAKANPIVKADKVAKI